MPGKLTTHVLDTAHGRPAGNLAIELWSLRGNSRTLLKTVRTNADGRTEQPLLAAADFTTGEYELVFAVGDYFAAEAATPSSADAPIRFLDKVPVRFGIA